MTREKGPVTIPDLVLERYRLGELPPAEAEAVARRREEQDVRFRLEALARSDEEMRRRDSPRGLARQVRARLAASGGGGPRPSAWSRYWPLPVSLAAAATVVVMFFPEAIRPIPPASTGVPSSPPATDRIKGLKPALALFRKTGDRSEALASGDVARAGDVIRVGYRAAGRRFGVILSLDGRGHVTVHLPTRGGQAVVLQSGEVVLLDHAFELDDAPRWERFFFVTSETPFAIAPLVEDARQAGAGVAPPAALKLPPAFEQAAFSLEKEARP